MSELELLFLGTGTSAGIPMIGCRCAVCASPDARDRRSRPSVLVRYGQPLADGEFAASVLIDTTPELRLQCLAHKVERVDAVVLTHAHADHIMGMDDLRRFNTLRGGPLDVWADAQTHRVVGQAFGYAFGPPRPTEKVYRPHLVARTIEGPFQIGPATWTPLPLLHGDMAVLGFRIGKVAYCTDVSQIPPATWPLLENLDVLVLDGLQFQKHATHLTIHEAIALAGNLKPQRTYLTHIAHGVAHAATEAALPEGVFLAYDGLRIRGQL